MEYTIYVDTPEEARKVHAVIEEIMQARVATRLGLDRYGFFPVPAPAPAPAAEMPTQQDVDLVVRNLANTKGVPFVREFFSRFGITKSSDLPAEKRAEFIAAAQEVA